MENQEMLKEIMSKLNQLSYDINNRLSNVEDRLSTIEAEQQKNKFKVRCAWQRFGEFNIESQRNS